MSENRNMIPVEAVEAAVSDEAVATAMFELFGDKDNWASEEDIEGAIARTKRALEAAAPYMMGECEAEALEDAAAAFPSYGPESTPVDAITWLQERAALIRKGVHP